MAKLVVMIDGSDSLLDLRTICQVERRETQAKLHFDEQYY